MESVEVQPLNMRKFGSSTFTKLPAVAAPSALATRRPATSAVRKRRRGKFVRASEALLSASTSTSAAYAHLSLAEHEHQLQRRRQLAALPPQRQRAPRGEDTAFWRFPVYYNAEQDAEELRQAQADTAAAAAARAATVVLEEAVLRAAALEEAEAAADWGVYMEHAARWGALDGIGYACTGRPGELFMAAVQRALRVLQAWWPVRFAANRAWHLRNAPIVLWRQVLPKAIERFEQYTRNEYVVHTCLRRMAKQLEFRVVAAWHSHTERARKCRQLLTRVQHRERRELFAKWLEGSIREQEDRERRLVFALSRLTRHIEVRSFNRWAVWLHQQTGSRELLKRVKEEKRKVRFHRWVEGVKVQKWERVMDAAATKIQHCVLRHQTHVHYIEDRKARKMQQAFRAHEARVEMGMVKSCRKQAAAKRERAGAARRELEELRGRAVREALRHRAEWKELLAAADEAEHAARHSMSKMFRGGSVKAEYKAEKGRMKQEMLGRGREVHKSEVADKSRATVVGRVRQRAIDSERAFFRKKQPAAWGDAHTAEKCDEKCARMREELEAAAQRMRDEIEAMPQSFVKTMHGTTFSSLTVDLGKDIELQVKVSDIR